MRVLQINVNGMSGSTGKIVTDIKNVLLQEGYECVIAYGANDNINNENYIRICPEFERRVNAAISRVTGVKHGLFTSLSFYRLKSIIEREQPDIVHVHCPNGYIINLFKLLEYLGENKIKTVVTNHAEYYYTGGCGYSFDCELWKTGCMRCNIIKGRIPFFDASKYTWNKFKDAFSCFDNDKLIITSVSPWTKSRAESSPAQCNFRHEVVKNGIDTSIFKYIGKKNDVLIRLSSGRKIILHVTASFSLDNKDIKGGRYIAESARKMPQCLFVVAASFVHVTQEELPENIYLWGRTKDQYELAELYNTADCTLITSKRETFSMIVAESLCCGTPIVGFRAGGPESIALSDFSRFVENGNIEELKNSLLDYVNQHTNREQISEMAIEKYGKIVMANNYLKIYRQLL